MSNGPAKAEYVVRIEQLNEAAEAERNLQSAAYTFEEAERKAVQAAEQLIEWALHWQESRAKLLNPELASLTAEAATFYGNGSHLANARALMDLFCSRIRREQAPSQAVPSPELQTATPGAEEETGGPIIDVQTCEPVDPHVSWEPPPPTEAEPDPIVDAGGYAPVTDGDYVEHISVLTGDPAVEPESGLHDRLAQFAQFMERPGAVAVEIGDMIPVNSAEHTWLYESGYIATSIDPTFAQGIGDGRVIAYAPVASPEPTEAETDASGSVLDDPELQAAVGRAQATLVDAELDAELDRVREQERARAKHHFAIFGKLEDA